MQALFSSRSLSLFHSTHPSTYTHTHVSALSSCFIHSHLFFFPQVSSLFPLIYFPNFFPPSLSHSLCHSPPLFFISASSCAVPSLRSSHFLFPLTFPEPFFLSSVAGPLPSLSFSLRLPSLSFGLPRVDTYEEHLLSPAGIQAGPLIICYFHQSSSFFFLFRFDSFSE